MQTSVSEHGSGFPRCTSPLAAAAATPWWDLQPAGSCSRCWHGAACLLVMLPGSGLLLPAEGEELRKAGAWGGAGAKVPVSSCCGVVPASFAPSASSSRRWGCRWCSPPSGPPQDFTVGCCCCGSQPGRALPSWQLWVSPALSCCLSTAPLFPPGGVHHSWPHF